MISICSFSSPGRERRPYPHVSSYNYTVWGTIMPADIETLVQTFISYFIMTIMIIYSVPTQRNPSPLLAGKETYDTMFSQRLYPQSFKEYDTLSWRAFITLITLSGCFPIVTQSCALGKKSEMYWFFTSWTRVHVRSYRCHLGYSSGENSTTALYHDTFKIVMRRHEEVTDWVREGNSGYCRNSGNTERHHSGPFTLPLQAVTESPLNFKDLTSSKAVKWSLLFHTYVLHLSISFLSVFKDS